MDATKSAETSQQETQIVRIWDDPESRIHFLETVLKGKEWEAVIYHPDFAPDGTQKQGVPSPLPELEKKLKARGYKTSLGEDENGIPVLNVHRFGHDTSLSEAVHELGFVKGMSHKLVNIGEPLGNAMQKTADMVKHVATDKARLVGGVYLVGDLFLILAGFFNKEKDPTAAPKGNFSSNILNKMQGFLHEMQDPANLLHSTAGVLATLQSLIYMRYAKQGSEAMYAELMQHASQATEQGMDLLSAEAWVNKQDNKSQGLFNLPQRMLKDYPIQLGALSQIAGQLSLMASGGIRLSRNRGIAGEKAADARSGAVMDIMTGVMSATGWSLLTKTKPSKIAEEDKHPWSDPRRVWQEMSESPNQFASGFLTAATVTGYIGGKKKNNTIQKLGNVTYLMGDGIMFLTKSEHYGAEGMSNAVMLAEAAEQFVKASPMILGEKEQAQLVGQLSTYLAERNLHEEARKSKRDTQITAQEVQELSEGIAAGLNAKLPRVNDRANEAAGCIAGLVRSFHPDIGEKLTDALCETICDMAGVAIDKEELKSHVVRQTEYPKETPTKPIKMDDIAKPMADLIFAIPGAATPASVDRIYNVIDDYVRPEPLKGKEPLEKAINQKAAKDVAATIAPPQSQLPLQSQPVPAMGGHTAALGASRQQQLQGADVSR